MKIYLIRHGKTRGNVEHRYIGTTDESLCEEGISEIKKRVNEQYYPTAIDVLSVSPLKRCQETAEIIFPGIEQNIVHDFRETDFGLFENKNYEELCAESLYQEWLDSNGMRPFPNGESREEFQNRCSQAFQQLLLDWTENAVSTAAIVAHGGTIMSIVSTITSTEFYDWQVKNGECLCLSINSDTIKGKKEVFIARQ